MNNFIHLNVDCGDKILQGYTNIDVAQEPVQFKLKEPRDMRVTGKKPSESA